MPFTEPEAVQVLGVKLITANIRYNVYAGYNYRDWKNVSDRRVDRIIFEDEENLRQTTDSESQESRSHL